MTLPDDVEEDLDRYLDRNPDATVPEVLGKFLLDPEEHADAVADRLDHRPLKAYQPAGCVAGVADQDATDRALALDAAVALTASRWGPPFDSAVEPGDWSHEAYAAAAEAVEGAIVAALLADPEGDEANPPGGQATLGEVAE